MLKYTHSIINRLPIYLSLVTKRDSVELTSILRKSINTMSLSESITQMEKVKVKVKVKVIVIDTKTQSNTKELI